jgi:hypothetical protein
LELEQARYQARLAERRYEAADPENRLVAGELEARWNAELERVAHAEEALRAVQERRPVVELDRERLMRLAEDLPYVWRSTTDKRLKQQIAHTLLVEVGADVDEKTSEVQLIFHWVGGRHSEVRVPKNRPGSHSKITSADALAVILAMAGRFDDPAIAATLNRLKLKTGRGNTWIESRVRSARIARKLPNYDGASRDGSHVTLQEAAKHFGVSPTAIRNLLEDGVIPGEQVVPCAPWMIPAAALRETRVIKAVDMVKSGKRRPRTQDKKQETLDFTSSS